MKDLSQYQSLMKPVEEFKEYRGNNKRIRKKKRIRNKNNLKHCCV
jgi:hypothetical protein